MLSLTAAQITALSQNHLRRRIFVWCDALGLDGSSPAPAGFWNDVGNVTISGRVYSGSGNIINVEALAATSDMAIPGLRVTLSGIPLEVASLVRGSTVGQRPIEVHVGLYSVTTAALLPPLIPRFVGKVDYVEIRTPESGGDSDVVLTCESTSRALTIKRTGTRSNGTQQERSATDVFYQYTGVVRERTVYFGRKTPRVTSSKK